MRKYFSEYRRYFRKRLEEEGFSEELLREHLDKISFFQHERLIHLLVTILFALMTLAAILAFLFLEYLPLALLSLLFLCLTVPYIRHYYFLENQTQELYKDYDELLKKKKETESDKQ